MRRRLLSLVWRVTPITPGKYTATPWWMGVAWYRLDTDSMVLVALPLNLIVRALRSLMIGLRFPHAGRQVDAQIMYADGYAQGFADGATQVLADLHSTARDAEHEDAFV